MGAGAGWGQRLLGLVESTVSVGTSVLWSQRLLGLVESTVLVGLSSASNGHSVDFSGSVCSRTEGSSRKQTNNSTRELHIVLTVERMSCGFF